MIRTQGHVPIYKAIGILKERFESEEFLNSKGQLNYWVFDYDPKDELIVRSEVERLLQRNQNSYQPFKLFVYDIYEMILNHLEEKSYLEKCKAMEENHGLVYLSSAVQRTLRLQSKENVIISQVIQDLEKSNAENNVVFFVGMGKTYPLLLSSDVFNKVFYNLPLDFVNNPMILFYPGTYTEQELLLFDDINEGNYYRARKIVR